MYEHEHIMESAEEAAARTVLNIIHRNIAGKGSNHPKGTLR